MSFFPFHSIAYLDGGTGSLIIQAVIASVVTTGYVVKSRWHLLKETFRRSPMKSEKTTS